MTGPLASAETVVPADQAAVWRAITDPDQVKMWFFGTQLRTDWQPGSPITWSGEWEGTPYEDKGEVVAVDEPNRLEVTHYSPLTGQEDVPENYHHLVYVLAPANQGTRLTITQDNNADQAEADRNTEQWDMVLGSLSEYLTDGSGT